MEVAVRDGDHADIDAASEFLLRPIEDAGGAAGMVIAGDQQNFMDVPASLEIGKDHARFVAGRVHLGRIRDKPLGGVSFSNRIIDGEIAFMLAVKLAGIGNVSVVGSEETREGRLGSLKFTLPAGPKTDG